MSNAIQNKRAGPDAENPQGEAISSAIRHLLSALGNDERIHLLKELAKEHAIDSPRAGGVLATVLRLIPKDQHFSADDIKKAVGAAGVEASAKQVYNALGYLAEKGRIQRIKHGHYFVDGALFVTQDDLGGAPSRTEEHDANS